MREQEVHMNVTTEAYNLDNSLNQISDLAEGDSD